MARRIEWWSGEKDRPLAVFAPCPCGCGNGEWYLSTSGPNGAGVSIFLQDEEEARRLAFVMGVPLRDARGEWSGLDLSRGGDVSVDRRVVTRSFATEAEARAFCLGIEHVNDSAISATDPTYNGASGEWEVTVLDMDGGDHG